MRAKVASRANGHVFEDRFQKLEGKHLIIAYKQAVKEDKQRYEEIKILEKVLDRKFENLYMFADKDLYQQVQQYKEMGQHREEIPEEEFPELWEEILTQIPEAIVAEEPEQDPYANLLKADQETEDYLAGFTPYNFGEDGEE